MRRAGMSRAEIHAALIQINQDRCKPPLAAREVDKVATSICRYEPDQITVAVVENHWAQDAQPTTTEAASPLPDPVDR